MSPEDWDRTNDPWAMLRSLGWQRGERRTPLHLSARKLRLFACAAVRAAGFATLGGWPESPSSQAVRAAERMADGRISAREVNDAAHRCRNVDGQRDSWAAMLLCPSPSLALDGWHDGFPMASAGLAALLRDVAGGPAGPPRLPDGPMGPCPSLGCQGGRKENADGWLVLKCGRCKGKGVAPGPPPWLSAPGVLGLALAAYDDLPCPGCGSTGGIVPPEVPCGTCHGTGVRWSLDGARLGVLADCLEEAGCTDAGMLAHLRGPGPHVRGCWALDRALGRR